MILQQPSLQHDTEATEDEGEGELIAKALIRDAVNALAAPLRFRDGQCRHRHAAGVDLYTIDRQNAAWTATITREPRDDGTRARELLYSGPSSADAILWCHIHAIAAGDAGDDEGPDFTLPSSRLQIESAGYRLEIDPSGSGAWRLRDPDGEIIGRFQSPRQAQLFARIHHRVTA